MRLYGVRRLVFLVLRPISSRPCRSSVTCQLCERKAPAGWCVAVLEEDHRQCIFQTNTIAAVYPGPHVLELHHADEIVRLRQKPLQACTPSLRFLPLVPVAPDSARGGEGSGIVLKNGPCLRRKNSGNRLGATHREFRAVHLGRSTGVHMRRGMLLHTHTTVLAQIVLKLLACLVRVASTLNDRTRKEILGHVGTKIGYATTHGVLNRFLLTSSKAWCSTLRHISRKRSGRRKF